MKSTNDKIDEIKNRIRYNKHDMGELGDFIRIKYVENILDEMLPKLIKETLQECLGQDEPEPMVKDGNYSDPICVARNQLRKQALTKLEDLLGEYSKQ